MASTLKVDILQDSGGNNLVTSNGSGVITSAGFGKIGQVVQDVTQGTLSSSSTTYSDICSLTITPSSTSSKILLCFQANGSVGPDEYIGISLFKDGTAISGSQGNTASGNRVNETAGVQAIGNESRSIYRQQNESGMYLDSPASSSQITYALKFRRTYSNSNDTVYINRNVDDNNGGYNIRTISTLTAMEILP